MSTILIVVLIVAAFGLALVMRRYEHTLFYVIFCAAAFVWFLAVTIVKAGEASIYVTILSGILTLALLWRTITLAMRLKQAQSQKPLP